MPELRITIDIEEGTCETEIHGVRSAACESTARKIREVIGSPTVDRKTSEYYLVELENQRQIKGGGNRS